MRLKNFSLTFGVQVFKSLSDDARVRILNLMLNYGELCITDIELILSFTQTKTSRHLSYLKNAGLVGTKRYDKYVFYYIKDEVLDILQQVFSYLEKDVQLTADKDTFVVLYKNRELVLNKLKGIQLYPDL
ncbi:metalloregulator ArsR/SmtB family transcription factor [Mangrovivirga sp. M17]|uniref:Metalloregulator ArsR/SmtB family transcription factor n=1 Tax=Mangrovivirga halotolerans TaxID=2993936 RepID=A0ABT3RMJ6_9BACT|nr:metalloregulator ArsR/SmtB family transcription factor [Mangrovivirga halotolerans]MCX2742969.1 metalloregulator ArsR/SmtB family transcription factor [Mangrovivirga halotolerans]